MSLILTLAVSGRSLPAALLDTWREVAAHDAGTLRLRHHGWYARLAEVLAAIDRQVPLDEPIMLDPGSVPPWFLAAYNPHREIWKHSPELVAEWTAAGRVWWALQLREDIPLRWSLQRMAPAAEGTAVPGNGPR